jgi:NAD(P)-dependent dehydrogenase (short-subunit alcohol dehydrogenase family)
VSTTAATSASTLDGVRIAVVSLGTGLGPSLVGHLASGGATVALVGDGGPSDGVAFIDASFATREETERALGTAVAGLGGLDALVLVLVGPAALEAKPFVDVSPAEWASGFDAPALAAVFCLQAAFAHLRGRGGRIVLIVPTVVFSGARGLATLAAAAEGQRLLAKSAARQWGRAGITVNCVATSTELVHGPWPDATADVLERLVGMGTVDGGPSFCGGAAVDVATDLLPVVAFLVSPQSGRVTGQTIVADGGAWMVP